MLLSLMIFWLFIIEVSVMLIVLVLGERCVMCIYLFVVDVIGSWGVLVFLVDVDLVLMLMNLVMVIVRVMLVVMRWLCEG